MHIFGRFAFACAAAALASVASAQEVTPPPPAPEGQSGAVLLPSLIEHSRQRASWLDGELGGAGAELLRAIGRSSHFVMLGEEHGNAGLAAFATAYWRELSALGFRFAAIEVDPYIASAATRELQAGGVAQWGRYLRDHGGETGAPFLNWSPEAELAAAVVQSPGAPKGGALWGLDQVFTGSTPYRLRDIAESTGNAKARDLAGRLAKAGIAARSNDWLGTVPIEDLIELRASLTDRGEAAQARVADDLIVTRRIYAPFLGGAGEPHFANDERETLMKRTFQARFEEAARTMGQNPRVMLKLGAYHIARGATPTWVQGLGGFVTEYGLSRGLSAASLMLICKPNGPSSCPDGLAAEFEFLAPYLDARDITIFDLRVWRLRPSRWSHLSAAQQMVIGAYDFLVFVPDGGPAALLPEIDARPSPE